MTVRQALAIAREAARKARTMGTIYSQDIPLSDGRLLQVRHADAVGGGQLFGVWVYTYCEYGQKPEKTRPLF
jgi:hypothetical protein